MLTTDMIRKILALNDDDLEEFLHVAMQENKYRRLKKIKENLKEYRDLVYKKQKQKQISSHKHKGNDS